MSESIYVKGNNDGDYLFIKPLKDNMLGIEIGHCCVVSVRHEIPVEVVTAILTKASFDDFKDGVEGWPDDFSSELKNKIRKLNPDEHL